MPEGPEVWILSKALNKYYNNKNTYSAGKHLFVTDINENWSFGLTGKVLIDPTDTLCKINSGWIYGDKLQITLTKLGLDWMTANKDELEKEVDKWIKSKKKLAGLLLDQDKICGIGVAWGSEILFKAELRPDVRACDQVLDKLVDTMVEIRNNIKNIYETELQNHNNLKEFVNEWFENLYDLREMSIYKKGSKLQVLGRSWWV